MQCRDIISELVSDILHREVEFTSCDIDFGYMHPTNTFAVSVGGERIGTLSVPHPTVLGNIDKKCAVAFFELYTEDFAKVALGVNKYAEPSRFPAIDIDLTFTCDVSAVNFDAVVSAAKGAVGELLSDVRMKYVYTDDAGVSALTLRFSFVSRERTLTKGELEPHTAAIVTALAEMGIALKA